MNKQDIYNYLTEQNISYEISEHEAVFNMEEMEKLDLLYPGLDAKNLFIRDDKKRNYYLITIKGNKSINLKDFRQKYETRALSFASADDLMSKLNLIPGAVTPFGLLNDKEHTVTLYIDKEFKDDKGIIGVHPNDNTATVWLNVDDLVKLIEQNGNTVIWM